MMTERLTRDPAIAASIIAALIGALLGLTVAFFTAISSKGVTHKEMEDYVKEYSPYVMDKPSISEHQAEQDKDIGKLQGQQEQILGRLNGDENKIGMNEKELSDCEIVIKSKMDLIGNYLEEEKKVKK